MLAYKMAPANLVRAYRPGPGFPAPRPMLGLVGPAAKAGVVGLGVGALLSAATAWVGFSTGTREGGLLSALGYVIGSLGALGAISGAAGIGILGISALEGDAPAKQTTSQTPSNEL